MPTRRNRGDCSAEAMVGYKQGSCRTGGSASPKSMYILASVRTGQIGLGESQGKEIMSKIHDALKKAQQERSLGAAASNQRGPNELDESPNSRRDLAATVAGGHHSTADSGRDENWEEFLRFEHLLKHCAKPTWSLDQNEVVFGGPDSGLSGAEQFRTLRARLYHIRETLPLNKRLEILLDCVGSVFDWIIFDSPPCLPVADASVLADHCDGVVLVVRAESTPWEIAQRARQELKERNIVGVVLNAVSGADAYGGYYGYGDSKDARK